MNTPFKMKGWSPFTKKTKTHSTQVDDTKKKQKLNIKVPKSHPVIPPTKEQKDESKGTLNLTKQMLKDMRSKDTHADHGTYGIYQ